MLVWKFSDFKKGECNEMEEMKVGMGGFTYGIKDKEIEKRKVQCIVF
jgi:hypothetical protein